MMKLTHEWSFFVGWTRVIFGPSLPAKSVRVSHQLPFSPLTSGLTQRI